MGMKKFLFGLVGIVCALFAVPAHALPAGYTELEYIRFDGLQYIITNYTMDQASNPKVELKIKNKQGAAFGAQNDNSRSIVDFSSQLYCGAGTNRLSYTLQDDDAVHTLSGEYNTNTTVLSVYIDGVLQTSGEQSGSFSTNKLSLGDINGGNGGTRLSGDVYSFKVYQNNTLVLNLIPAKRNSDNAIGMYDTVSNTFFTNAGTGAFVAGPTACDGERVTYTSATGTVTQNGTPTPTNPITPVFYTQGNMVLRKVGDYADTYDATTGKITRRVGVKVFDGTEDWTNPNEHQFNFNAGVRFAVTSNTDEIAVIDSHFRNTASSGTDGDWYASVSGLSFATCLHNSGTGMRFKDTSINTLAEWKQWLAQQYAAGTPVTAWYPLATETTEDWTGGTSYCQQAIKVATTKYVETEFSALNTALANAVATVNTVVTQTIAQAASIATLQSGKQTRPDETCPAGKKCLLVTDENNIPHWYEIVEPLLPAGYIQLQWIESTGTQFIDTGIKANASIVVDMGVLFRGIGVFAALGTRNGTNTSDTNVFQFGVNSNNTFFHRYGMGSPYSTGVPVAQMLYDVHLENYKEIISNGQDTYTDTLEFNPDMDTEGTLYIFATHDISSGRPIFSMPGYITYLSISVAGVLVRDFVPAKNPDGKIGMYDLVGGRFYENAGEGSFIAGPVAE